MPSVNLSSLFFLAEGISKKFSGREVLKSVSFSLTAGECVLLEGDNGSGKSTLLKILAGALRPDAFQTIAISNEAAYPSPAYRANIAYLSHAPMLYPDLSATENLLFTAALYRKISTSESRSKLLARVNLEKRKDDPVKTLSRGMQQRLAICRLLVTEAKILLMDEPFTSLDRTSSGILADLISEQRSSGKTLLIATHDPELLANVAQRSLRLSKGKLEVSTA